jgi:hypothetical protein
VETDNQGNKKPAEIKENEQKILTLSQILYEVEILIENFSHVPLWL